MQRTAWHLLSAILLTFPLIADARGGGGHSGGSGHTHVRGHSGGSHAGSHFSKETTAARTPREHPTRAVGVQRDKHGRIERSVKAKADFQRGHPCPSTGRASGSCPGYVVDHVTPLKRGGADHPSNMQWQTVQQAKIKDRTE